MNGKLIHGASDVAGEIGHITVDFNGRRCGCGNDGCLEAYASGPAIARRTVEALQAVRQHRQDVLVQDIRMPEKDGFTVLREMKREKLATKVVAGLP